MSENMSDQEHFRRLEALYQAAPINRFFAAQMQVSAGVARITLEVKNDFFHAANAAHGAVYFKLLDDSAFFAVASQVRDVFVLTTGFNLHLTRPLHAGPVVAEGRWIHGHRRVFLAESILRNADGEEVARGSGSFTRGRMPLMELPAYRDADIAP